MFKEDIKKNYVGVKKMLQTNCKLSEKSVEQNVTNFPASLSLDK